VTSLWCLAARVPRAARDIRRVRRRLPAGRWRWGRRPKPTASRPGSQAASRTPSRAAPRTRRGARSSSIS